jgi:leucyl-tRNA synthetase
MINQGMILGRSSFVYQFNRSIINFSDGNVETELIPSSELPIVFYSKEIYEKDKEFVIYKYKEIVEPYLVDYRNKGFVGEIETSFTSAKHVDISLVDNDKLDIEAFKNSREEYKNAVFICEEDGSYICGSEVEKMSKSKFNVQTPDELVEKFGADTLRMYEMFLGPLEQTKPWDTKGITGVHNFLRKLWRLFYQDGVAVFNDAEPSKASLKTLHKTIKKVEDDLERYSFNTNVSNMMICVNELTEQKCTSKAILEQVLILLSPYAPHVAEELWEAIGHPAGSISTASFPIFDPAMLEEDAFSYPVSFNGKMRFKLDLPSTLTKEEIHEAVMANADTQKWMEGKTPKNVIIVPKKIVNIVC